MLKQDSQISSMSFGDTWLEYIEIDIEKKYGIKNPIFLINQVECSHDVLHQWCDNVLFELRWIKYKRISENVFQLKSFFPDPPIGVCKKMINEELDYLNKRIVDMDPLGKTKIFYEFSSEIYESQDLKRELLYLKRELLYSLLSGDLNIGFYLQNEKSRIIVKVSVSSGIGSEMDPWLKSKHLSLEYHDDQ